MYSDEIRRAIELEMEKQGQIWDGHKPTIRRSDQTDAILVEFDRNKYEISVSTYYGDAEEWC